MRLIDADAMIEWYKSSFPFDHSEVRFSINDIESNMWNIPTVNPQIPMPERLPGEKGYYLVTRKNPRGHVTKARFNPNQVERGVYNSPWRLLLYRIQNTKLIGMIIYTVMRNLLIVIKLINFLS